MEEKIVDLVGEDELLDGDAACTEAGHQIDGLREVDVAVVVAMDEENRRFPGVDRADWRGIVGQFGEFGRDVFAVPIVGGPIVDAVEVHTCGEDVGVVRETHGGEEAAIAAAPEADAGRVDVGASLQEFSGGDYVAIFGGAAACASGGLAKGASVADAAAVVDGEDDI